MIGIKGDWKEDWFLELNIKTNPVFWLFIFLLPRHSGNISDFASAYRHTHTYTNPSIDHPDFFFISLSGEKLYSSMWPIKKERDPCKFQPTPSSPTVGNPSSNRPL